MSLCDDCGTDTTPRPMRPGSWEWYMVTDAVWAEAGMPTDAERPFDGDGFLCVGCLEGRLGRRLARRDFTDAPINWPDGRLNSPRLNERLTHLTGRS